MSKSVAKAPRVGIGREKKRGISTILLAHSSVGVRRLGIHRKQRRSLVDRRLGLRIGPLRKDALPWG